MKAVILAAGNGIRLRPLTERIPKGLVEIEGKALLEYSLENIAQASIQGAVIVIGRLGNMIADRLGDSYAGVNIGYVIEHVENPEHKTTDSMYSFTETRGLLADDIILLDADLLYEPKAISLLINDPAPNVMLTPQLSGSGDEYYVCVDENGNLSEYGRDVPHPEQAVGEMMGITKLSKHFVDEYYKLAEQGFVKGDKTRSYDAVMFELSKKIPIKALAMPLVWGDVDNEQDLERLRAKIFPQLQEKLATVNKPD